MEKGKTRFNNGVKVAMQRKPLGQEGRFYFKPPEWVREIEDKQVASVIFALLFSWCYDGINHIDNIEKEIKNSFDNLSVKQINEIVDILIQHEVIRAQ